MVEKPVSHRGRYQRSRADALHLISMLTLLLCSSLILSGCDREGEASEMLYWGKTPDEAKMVQLKKLGVKTIVCVRIHSPKRTKLMAENFGFNFVHIRTSLIGQPRKDDVKRFVSMIANRANRPAYVCCFGGRDRTTFYIAAYRVAFEKWSPQAATREMRIHQLRMFWPTFWFYDNTLRKYEKDMRQLADELDGDLKPRSEYPPCPCLTMDGKPLHPVSEKQDPLLSVF